MGRTVWQAVRHLGPALPFLLWAVLVLGLATVARGACTPMCTIHYDGVYRCVVAEGCNDTGTMTCGTTIEPDTSREMALQRACMQRALDALRLERTRTRCAECGPANTNLGRLDHDASSSTTAAIACLEALLAPPVDTSPAIR